MTEFIQSPMFGLGQARPTSDDYYTPRWIFDRMAITFDLDVASPPGGVLWIPAHRHFTVADDGLAQPWTGRVWMNPPYSDAKPWVRKFIAHADGVCLLPHAKSAWHVELWAAASGICVIERFAFTMSNGKNGWPFLPVFFAAFGEECVEAIGRLGVVRRAA